MLNRNCPKCGFANAPEMNFCLNCGQNLAIANTFSSVNTFPPPRKNKSSAGVLLAVVGGLALVLLVGGVGFAVLLGYALSGDSDNDKKIVSVSPTPFSNLNSNRNVNYNSNSAGNSKISAPSNYNQNISNNNTTSGSDDRNKVYTSLTEGKTLKDVKQFKVGDYSLTATNSTTDFVTAIEREEWIYTNSKGKKLNVFCGRFAGGEEARRVLRETIKIFKGNGETVSEVTDCVNRADNKPIGLLASLYQKSINTYRVYWTDGAFLFVVSNASGTKEEPFDWMSHSSY